MAVYWTIQARQHLRRVLAEALHREHGADPPPCPGVLDRTRRRVDRVLEQAFGGAVVFVKDQVIGYRARRDLFILLIEVFATGDASQSGPYVVKIGPEQDLKDESRGWACCRPVGQVHDVVLLNLDPRGPFTMPTEGNGAGATSSEWMCLVYGDAQQVLGVNTTTTFEDAALQCVRHGTPTLDSLLAVVYELYERVGHLLYSQAYVDDPRDAINQKKEPRHVVLDGRHFDASLERWEADPPCVTVRAEVDAALASAVGKYLDPITYFRYVQDHVAHTVLRGDRPETRKPDPNRSPPIAGMAEPGPVDLIPRTLRGCAHGDLHGRNLLVGIVHDKAMWPTLFDYEDMGPGNAIGWDFVKFETELKIRAYHHVFAGLVATKYVEAICKFEVETHRRTEEAHRHQSWPSLGNPDERADRPRAISGELDRRAERLRAILLTIRRLAAQHLGIIPGRPNDWLEEYDFLLAAYGVGASRFENLQARERIGALVSAGVAAARLSWPRRLSRLFSVAP